MRWTLFGILVIQVFVSNRDGSVPINSLSNTHALNLYNNNNNTYVVSLHVINSRIDRFSTIK